MKIFYQSAISLQYGCPERPRGWKKRKKQHFDDPFSKSDLPCFLSVYDSRAGVEKNKSNFSAFQFINFHLWKLVGKSLCIFKVCAFFQLWSGTRETNVSVICAKRDWSTHLVIIDSTAFLDKTHPTLPLIGCLCCGVKIVRVRISVQANQRQSWGIGENVVGTLPPLVKTIWQQQTQCKKRKKKIILINKKHST